MIIINTVDSTKFTFNGITYFKNFTPVVRGNYIEVVNTYDARLRLTDAPVLFSDFTVDGSTYASVSLLQQALLPILFTRDSLGSGSGVGTLQEVTTNGATSNVETDFTTLVNGKVVTYDGEAVTVFRGEWNASTNTPALDNTDTGVKGFFYRVTVAGTVDFGDGNISFNVGDYVAFEVDKWVKFISNGNNFIPLSGTTSGNPVTGEIEFEEFGRTFWTPSENAPNDYNFINLSEAAVLIGYMNEISSEEFTAAIGLTGLSIMANIDGSGGIENSKGISSNLYFGANYDDNTYVQKKYVDDTKNIGATAENLTLTGAVNIDVLASADDNYFILTGNTTITWTNTPASGQSVIRSFIVKSTTAETLTLPAADISKGTFANDGSENQITVKFSNFATEGLKIVQFINPA